MTHGGTDLRGAHIHQEQRQGGKLTSRRRPPSRRRPSHDRPSPSPHHPTYAMLSVRQFVEVCRGISNLVVVRFCANSYRVRKRK